MERKPAQALDETSLTPSEPVIVVLSQQGWVRAARREVDAAALSYKAGDGFLMQAQGRSNQLAVFLDSTGRSYALPAHSLASARGYGEPLTGRLSPPDGARFVGVVLGNPEELYLLASSAGYGFICTLEDLATRNKTGKVVLTLADGVDALPPVRITTLDSDRLVAVTSSGHLLVFPIKELPQLPRGKGNKIIDIPAVKGGTPADILIAVTSIPAGAGAVLYSGKRSLTLRAVDLDHYAGERGRRGKLLPRGFQRVNGLSVVE